MKIDELRTPCYVIDEGKLTENLLILNGVMQRTGARILLAQKAFSAFYEYPLIGRYLSGTTASGLFEARLAHEEMGKENHVFCPAFLPQEMDELVEICDHIVFNSVSQYLLHRDKIEKADKKISVGLRINPECSTQEGHEIYDPCAPGSRLGITREALDKAIKNGLDLSRMLEKCIMHMRDKYDLEIYLEPGEAVALDAGYLETTVLDIVENNGIKILILDTSAACHMPDVLEMPYRPPLMDSGEPGEKKYTYRLSSCTCLAGDVIGDYSFDREIKTGDRLCFCDMAIYSMVKNNTFNGMPLPDIAVMDENNDCKVIRRFEYEDFKCRLS